MKTIHMFFLLILIMFLQNGYTQDYKDYYKLTTKAYNALTKENNLQKSYDLYKKAFKYKFSFSWDYATAAEVAMKLNKKNEFKKLLMKTAKLGKDINNIKEYYPYTDSIISKYKLKDKYITTYQRSMRPNIETSCKIQMLFIKDQYVRKGAHCISDDTASRKCYTEFFNEVDSTNYFSLMEIIKKPCFNLARVTDEAKNGMFLILAHSLTTNYAIPYIDTIKAVLMSEVKKGHIENVIYANTIDRYYHIMNNMNYYCQFMSKSLPIYDVDNLDKRREAIGLEPLYIKYKNENSLDLLPKEYKYDVNTIEQW
jgi:hypothetical protein